MRGSDLFRCASFNLWFETLAVPAYKYAPQVFWSTYRERGQNHRSTCRALCMLGRESAQFSPYVCVPPYTKPFDNHLLKPMILIESCSTATPPAARAPRKTTSTTTSAALQLVPSYYSALFTASDSNLFRSLTCRTLARTKHPGCAYMATLHIQGGWSGEGSNFRPGDGKQRS